MTLRINHNSAAINAHRNLVQNDERLSKSLEHLSSGLKVNRAADGPATLVISEQMRGQVAGLTQAIMNSETAVSLIQTTEANLNEVNRLLISMRQLSIHAANEGINDEGMLEADQAELANAISSIDRIAKNAQFGRTKILDGSKGVSGIASGDELEFLGASTKTKGSPQAGYKVTVDQEASQAQIKGTIPLTQDLLDGGEILTFQEGGRSLQFTTGLSEMPEQMENRLNDELRNTGLKLNAYFDQGKLVVLHQDYGSAEGFSASSGTAGVLSVKGDTPVWVQNGQDVRGQIGGETAFGEGQVLTGAQGTNVEGLQVRFTGVADPLNPEAGRVSLSSGALTFQVGGNHNQTTSVLLPNTQTDTLGTKVNNESGFRSIRDLDVRTFQGAQDALLMIDDAINQITSTRADLGAVQKNTLESNISSLRVAKESLTSAESVIRDADMAEEMSEFTRNQIMTQSATAMLAQANQAPNNVLTLLK